MTTSGRPRGNFFWVSWLLLAVLDKLSAAFKAVLESPEVRGRMVQQGADPAFLGGDDFGRFLANELPRWAQAVKASGARLD